MGVYHNIATAALSWGISLDRWHNSITTMIEKQPGCPRINKLRVIHLYEADYNLLLKIIWARRLVWHAHDLNKLNEGQVRSRPGRNAIDVVIQKEMKYLYATLTRTGLATMDNDAKSCYDRIICNLAMLVSQHLGVSKEVASSQAETLKKMIFRIRTAIGDSKQSYRHSTSTPIHGTGQGSCASPAIWLLVCSLLMDCLSKIGHGMTLTDVTGTRTLRQLIDGFVDDTSLFTNFLKTVIDLNDIELLTRRLQHDMIAWKELLEASGGKLELTKCFYYILTWRFDHKGNPFPTTIAEQRERAAQIKVPDTITKNYRGAQNPRMF
jgi:Reverse transcriptase (RNA-dependent DNA polymerase)